MSSAHPDGATQLPSAYTQWAFWDFYTQSYWLDGPEAKGASKASKESNGQVRLAATRLWQSLLHGNPRLDGGQYVDILVLGAGMLTMELPLLAHLERVSGKKLRLLCVDKHWQPLHVAEQLVAPCRESLRASLSWRTAAVVEAVRNLWPATGAKPLTVTTCVEAPPKTWSGDAANQPQNQFRFWVRDLDTEASVAGATAAPSRWCAELLDEWGGNALPEPGLFDVVICSFTLFHLSNWRRTLLHGLSLLRSGGAMLYTEMDGDEDIYEGSRYYVGAAHPPGKGRFIEEAAQLFYSEEWARTALFAERRSHSATSGGGLETFIADATQVEPLSRTCVGGVVRPLADSVDPVEPVQFTAGHSSAELGKYHLVNHVEAKQIANLYSTAGWSFMRRLADAEAIAVEAGATASTRKASRYLELADRIGSAAEGHNRPDLLKFVLRWRGLRVHHMPNGAWLHLPSAWGLHSADWMPGRGAA